MPINAGYEYFNAEKEYLNAKTLDEKILTLEQMIRVSPSHKGAENLRAELKTRLKKFREKAEKAKKSGKSSKKGIKKEGFQFVLLGKTNSGKSLLLSKLTNASPKISEFPFTTRASEIGTFYYQGIKAQIIDTPSIGSENFDIGIMHTADCLLIVIENLSELSGLEPIIKRTLGKSLIIINKSDKLSENELRKLEATIKSKKLNGIIISALTGYNLLQLKEKMILMMNVIRIYMKEPGKPHSPIPAILPINSNVRDIAESIRKGFSSQVKESRVTGPSSKFPNQVVGLSHILKDRDIVEFKTK